MLRGNKAVTALTPDPGTMNISGTPGSLLENVRNVTDKSIPGPSSLSVTCCGTVTTAALYIFPDKISALNHGYHGM